MRLIVVLFSTLFAYLVVEAGYRVYAFHSIRNTLLAATLRQMSNSTTGVNAFSDVLAGSSVFDMRTGYRYRPSIEARSSDPVPVAWTDCRWEARSRDQFWIGRNRGRAIR